MQIEEIHIYGYGKLENLVIKDMKKILVFYGENEAGKSTLTSFIHSLLFGFPTKQQSELRYEPKHQAKYGGKLKIFHPEKGSFMLERVKGKAAGDVTITFENGLTGGEELLREILNGIDKSLYQSIFSFNLHGLQNIHQLKKEDIGKFLFSAGALGTEHLAYCESELLKEMEMRFKPGGRKPLLNDGLNELQKLNDDLKKAAQKNQEYETLTREKIMLQLELTDLQATLSLLKEQEDNWTEWKRIEPSVLEEKLLRLHIEEAGEVSFPYNGIEKYERLQLLINPLTAQIAGSKMKCKQIKEELEALAYNEELLEKESKIGSSIEKISLLEQMSLEINSTELTLMELEGEILQITQQLHVPYTEQEILNLNTSIYVKQKAEKIHRSQRNLLEKKLQLEERFQEEKGEMENIEAEMKNIQSELLPESKVQEMRERILPGASRENFEKDLSRMKEKIHLFRQNEQLRRKQKQYISYFLIFCLMASIAIAGFGFLNKINGFSAGGILGVFLFIYLVIKNNKSGKNQHEELQKLYDEEAALQDKLQSVQTGDSFFIGQQLERDDRLRFKFDTLTMKWEQQNLQYERVISKFEEWEKDYLELGELSAALTKELRLPSQFSSSHLLEGFLLIEKLKKLLLEKEKKIDKLKKLNTESKMIHDQLASFATFFLQSAAEPIEAAYLLKKKLKEEMEKKIRNQTCRTKLAEVIAVMEQQIAEQQTLNKELVLLWDEAGAADEEEFYELGKKNNNLKKMKLRIEELERFISSSRLNSQDLDYYSNMQNSGLALQKMNESMEAAKVKIPEVQRQLAELEYKLQMLEEGGVYAELLHSYKQKKYELEEEAKVWAAYRTARHVLSQTVEKYKNEHLPRMLAKAEEFLHFLTDGNYQRMILKEAGTGFLIQRKDQTYFEANELSQATTEQVYVSLRLALAVTLYEKYKLPIIIDDSFVNFDNHRTSKIMKLLKEFSNHQILFFTCHEHMLQYFNREDIFKLEKGKVMVG